MNVAIQLKAHNKRCETCCMTDKALTRHLPASSVMRIPTWPANNSFAIFYCSFSHSFARLAHSFSPPSLLSALADFRVCQEEEDEAERGRKIIWPLPPHCRISRGEGKRGEMGEMTTFCIFKPKQFPAPSSAMYASAEAVGSTSQVYELYFSAK